MNVAAAYAQSSLDEIKDVLAGATLTIYSVARPIVADHSVDRSGVLASFTFATPAFGPADGDVEAPLFVENPVLGKSCGTPGFARATTPDGATIADFSAGPGDREIKFSEVSCSSGAPVLITAFRFVPEGGWPERPEYYDTRPRPGYPMPRTL